MLAQHLVLNRTLHPAHFSYILCVGYISILFSCRVGHRSPLCMTYAYFIWQLPACSFHCCAYQISSVCGIVNISLNYLQVM